MLLCSSFELRFLVVVFRPPFQYREFCTNELSEKKLLGLVYAPITPPRPNSLSDNSS